MINVRVIPLVETIRSEDVPDSVYFSSKYKKYISNSKLKLINPTEGGSPEKYDKGLVSTYSPSLEFGSAVHECILQPESFYIEEGLDKPSGKLSGMIDEIIKNRNRNMSIEDSIIQASKTIGYYTNSLTDNRIHNVIDKCLEYYLKIGNYPIKDGKEPIFLDANTREKVLSAIKCVKENNKIQEILNPPYMFEMQSINEQCITMDILVKFNKKEVLLSLKGKLDNFTISDNEVTLNDLKTTGKPVEYFPTDSFKHYHYARQMALYNWMLQLTCMHTYKVDNLIMNNPNMLLVTSRPPFESGIYTLSKEDLTNGLREFKDLIVRVALCELFGYTTQTIIDYSEDKLDNEL